MLLIAAVWSLGNTCRLPAAFNHKQEDVSRFFDRWVEAAMIEHPVPGVVVAMTRDGNPDFLRGYGHADLSSGTEMDPRSTILRVGSLSKVVAATAVLQLAERGGLDLMADVRQYVGTEILAGYPPGITLQQLLTHTAGVGDKFVGQTADDPGDLLNLRGYLVEETPPPMAPPRYFINYSNIGITLAAMAVETVSGQPFADYAQNEIFEPLGMDATSYVPDAELISRIAAGYSRPFGRYRVLALRHWRPYPASSLVSTGKDMARFLSAHLGGMSEDPKLGPEGTDGPISAEIRAAFRRRQFSMHPRIPGLTYVLWERTENGVRLLWHSGHMPGHRSGLFLFPHDGVGLFINSNSEFRLFEPFISDFLDRFYPESEKPVRDSAGPVTNGEEGGGAENPIRESRFSYVGRYRHSWYPRSTLGKIVAFTGMQGKERVVRASDRIPGGITIDGVQYESRARDYFEEVAGDRVAGFWRSSNGKVWYLYEGGMNAYHRIGWFESVALHRVVVSVLTLGFFVSLILGLRTCGQSKKNCREHPKNSVSRLNPVRSSAVVVSGLLTVFILGMVLLAALGVYKMSEEVRWPLLALLALPPLSTIATVGLLVFLARSWRNPALRLLEKIHYLVLIVSAATAFAVLHYWNLFGYRF